MLGHRVANAESYYPMAIHQIEGRAQTPISKPSAPPVRRNRPWEVKVKVGATTLQVYLDGTAVMQGTKRRGEFGHFGFMPREFTDLVIEGVVTSAWLRGKTDAYMQEELTKFEASFDPRRELPPWLFKKVAVTATKKPRPMTETKPVPPAAAANATQLYPGVVGEAHIAAINQAATLTNSQQYEKGRRYLEALDDEGIPTGARAYLLSICYSALGQPETALIHCQVACAADSKFADSHVMRARILADLNRTDDAEREYRAVILQHPRDGLAYRLLTLLLFNRGDPHGAKLTIDAARSKGADIAEIARLERMLTMARQGPDWPLVFDYQSNNYHVFSDLDHRTCVSAARILEQALVSYKSQLVGIAKPEHRFRVYVFSGEAGYHAYCKNILGGYAVTPAGSMPAR